MDMNFGEIHQREIGDDVANNGFPDDGNGRYIQKKVYPEWYFMNVTKRQRNNGLEGIVTIAPLSLVNGLFLPYPTIGFLSTYFVGRYFYTEGYMKPEGVASKMRTAGAIMCHSSNFFTIFTTLGLGIMLSRGRLH